MTTTHEARMNGHRSFGTRRLKSHPDKRIYGFMVWGQLRWSGDLVNLRKTKREAYQDIGLLV